MAGKQKMISFEDLPSHLIFQVLICGLLTVTDLVNIELTSTLFGLNKEDYSSGFKSVAEHAASRLCCLHPLFVYLSSNHQMELFERCKRNWKRVLRFLQFSDMSAVTSKDKMQILTGYNYALVLKNSKVYICSSYELVVSAHGPETGRCMKLTEAIDVPLSPQVIQMSARNNNFAYVTESGEVFTCSRNEFGRLYPDFSISKPKLVESLKMTPCKQVENGIDFTVFLTRGGHVYTAGRNRFGQLGHGDTVDRHREVPKMVQGLEKVIQISVGPYYVLALTEDGSVYSFGDGNSFCHGDGSSENKLQPHLIQDFKTKGVHILSVSAGEEHVAAIDSNGYVYTWGKSYRGALGHGDEDKQRTPKVVCSLENHLAVQVCAGNMKSYVVVESGLVYKLG